MAALTSKPCICTSKELALCGKGHAALCSWEHLGCWCAAIMSPLSCVAARTEDTLPLLPLIPPALLYGHSWVRVWK